MGFHYSFGIEDAVAWARAGANLIVHSSDYFLVRDALRRDLAYLHDSLGDSRDGGGGDSMVVV